MSSIKRLLKRKLEQSFQNNNIDIIKEFENELLKYLDKPYNLILLSDGYKYSHVHFYTDKLKKKISYLEARGGMFGETLFAGLQIPLVKFLEGVAITKLDVDEAYERLGTKYGHFRREGIFDRSKFDYIVEKHGGKLPIKIKAVPEGTVVNHHNILMSIESLDEDCAWIVNFIEGLLLQIWYPIAVATLSREIKKIVTKAYRLTTDMSNEEIDAAVKLVLNDFGFRGVSSVESSSIGGLAHHINFDGSDNIIASLLINDIYETNNIYGVTIPATEHSTILMRGRTGEVETMESVLDTFPTGPVACVSDTWDIMNAVDNIWGDKLRSKILSRDSNSPLIIRPDSGSILVTLKKIFESLFRNFGYTETKDGFKVLPPQIRVIQGDGVNIDSIHNIYTMLIEEKISAANLALGMGGKLLQSGLDRDVHKFAFKPNYMIFDNKEVMASKEPIVFDDNGERHVSFKKSKPGHLKLVKNDDNRTYRTVSSFLHPEEFEMVQDELVEVFNYGVITKRYTFDEIRKNAEIKDYELE